MAMPSIPEQVITEAFRHLVPGAPEPDKAVVTLIAWWNETHENGAFEADHLAAYVSTPEGWWRNVLWEDPTEYGIAWFDAERSSSRWENVIIEFRVIRAVNGQSRSSPAATVESYLHIEPADAWAWSVRSLEEVRRHLDRLCSGEGAFTT